MFPSATKTVEKLREIAVDTLQTDLQNPVDTLRGILNALPEADGNYEVDSLSFNLALSGTGRISLIAEVGTGMTASMTVTMKRISR